jgi:hypothetical protein
MAILLLEWKRLDVRSLRAQKQCLAGSAKGFRVVMMDQWVPNARWKHCLQGRPLEESGKTYPRKHLRGEIITFTIQAGLSEANDFNKLIANFHHGTE